MDLFYVDANAGTWNYSLDGGANVPVVNAGGAAGVRSVKKISLTSLANTTHTIGHWLAWSRWRRIHQARARTSHYRRRGHPEHRPAST